MHPQDLADHAKNKPRQQFIICTSWYCGFIHKSKYFKKQKNSKSQKTDFLSFWELQQLAKVRDVHPVDQDLYLEIRYPSKNGSVKSLPEMYHCQSR